VADEIYFVKDIFQFYPGAALTWWFHRASYSGLAVMSTHQPNLYWITSDEREHQRLALLEQEIDIQRGASPFSALSTDHRSNLDEHRDTTNVSLVEQEDETLADQLSTGSTVADNMALRTSHDGALHQSTSNSSMVCSTFFCLPVRLPFLHLQSPSIYTTKTQ
jgi:hypothetical protein